MEKVKSVGKLILGLALFIGLLVVLIGIPVGIAVVGSWALPFLMTLMGLTTIIGLPLLLLLVAFNRTRSAGSIGLVIVSYVYGLTLWIWALLFTLITWGWLGVVIGVGLGGVGVVPIAMLASALHGQWSVLGQVFVAVVLTFGCRIFGTYMADRVDNTVSFVNL